MLFYVKCEVKQHYMALPEEMYEMQLKTLEYIFENKKSGRIVAGGTLAGKRGFIVIVNVESIEEFDEFCFAIPLFNLYEVELDPITSIENRRKLFENLKKESTMYTP